jgi:hypothetical protein
VAAVIAPSEKCLVPFDRLTDTGDGQFVRSFHLGKYVAGLPKKYPHLFLKKIDLRTVLLQICKQFGSVTRFLTEIKGKRAGIGGEALSV